jgi:hypothetical protein
MVSMLFKGASILASPGEGKALICDWHLFGDHFCDDNLPAVFASGAPLLNALFLCKG